MRVILIAVMILVLAISFCPMASAAATTTQKPQSSDPYFWDPFVTWFVDTATWVATGKYQPDYEEELPGTHRIRRVDAYDHGYNPWFW